MRQDLAEWFDYRVQDWERKPVSMVKSFCHDAELFKDEWDEGRRKILNLIINSLVIINAYEGDNKLPSDYYERLFDHTISNWEMKSFKDFRKIFNKARVILSNIPGDKKREDILNQMGRRLTVENDIRRERLRVVRQAAGRGVSLTLEEVGERMISLQKTKITEKTDKEQYQSAPISIHTPPPETLEERLKRARVGAGLVKSDEKEEEKGQDLDIQL